MKTYTIRETHDGKTRTVLDAGRTTSRGYTRSIKQFKTEAAAKAWISRRMKELNGIAGWEYTIEAQ